MAHFIVFLIYSLAFGLVISSPAVDEKSDMATTLTDDDDVSCDPQIADTCFGDVEDDLRKIFDPANDYAQANNVSMLRDICSAWNDSLSCTSDVIDDGCQVADGRVRFDHWNAALRQTWNHVCGQNFQILQDLFHGMKCFNVSAFLFCIETTADLKNMQDLMKTDLNVQECWYLKKVVQKCGEFVTLETCALEVMEPLNSIVDKFFQVGNCEVPSSFVDGSPTSVAHRISLSNYFILLVTLLGIKSNF